VVFVLLLFQSLTFLTAMVMLAVAESVGEPLSVTVTTRL
jgi:hypothetical protein